MECHFFAIVSVSYTHLDVYKRQIVHCLEGEFISELSDGSEHVLKHGMTYIVSDDLSSHRSKTQNGVKLLIIDGDFLKLTN